MFTKLYFRILEFIIGYSHYFGVVPFIWDPKHQKVYYTKDTIKRCRITGFIIYLYTLFFGIHAFLIKYNNKNTDINLFNLSLAYFFVYTMLCIAFSLYLFFPIRLTTLINEVHNFVITFQEKWMKEKDPENVKMNWYWDRLIIIWTVNCILIGICVAIHYFIFPNTIYLYAILPQSFKNNLFTSIPLYLLIGLFHIRITATVSFVCISQTALLGEQFFIALPLISNELMSNRKNYQTIDAIRKPLNLANVYRKFEVFHKVSMAINGTILLPVHVVITQSILSVNFILIRYWDVLDSITKGMLTILTISLHIIWFTVLNCGGLFHESSLATLKSWKYFKFPSKAEAKYIAKFKKSCRPLRIGTEGYFTIRRLTVLKFLRGVVRALFRALLTIKNV